MMNTSFKITIIRSVFLILSLLLFTGCARHLVPAPQKVNSQKVSEFKIDSRINLVNLQSANNDVFTLSAGMRTYKGNWAEWTEIAIKILSDELIKRGGHINKNGSKVLKLSVNKYSRDIGAFRVRYSINLHLELGNGYKTDYFAKNSIAAMGNSAARGFGGAITLAITDMLNDENVAAYLKEQ